MSESTQEIIVKATGVTKIYKRGAEELRALNGIDLEIYKGEYLCIMGPSGSGKSTFFNMVGGLDLPNEGEVLIKNCNLKHLNSDQLSWFRSRTVGYVFQSFNLIDILTARENVAMPMIYAGMSQKEADDKAAVLLEKVGLGHRLDHLPAEVSGGQQQRIAIARSLANDPEIILADEPTGNLDLKTGEEIIQLLKSLCEEHDTTVITVTHDMKMFNISDRIVWIRDGKIERLARRDELDIKIGGIK